MVEKGRLGPGEMIAVDTVRKRLLRNDEIKGEIAARRPYGEWLARRLLRLETHLNGDGGEQGARSNGHHGPDGAPAARPRIAAVGRSDLPPLWRAFG